MGQIIRKILSDDEPKCGKPLQSGHQNEKSTTAPPSSYAAWTETTSARSTSLPTSGLARTTSPPTSGLGRTTSPPTSGLARTTSPPTSGLARTTSPPSGLVRNTSPSSGLASTTFPSTCLGRTTSPPTGLARTTSPQNGLARTTSPPTGLARNTSPPSGLPWRTTSPPSGLARTTSPMTGLARITSPPTGLVRNTSSPIGLASTTFPSTWLGRTTSRPSTVLSRTILPSSRAVVSSYARVGIRPLFPRQEDFDDEREMYGVRPNLVQGPYAGCREYREMHARLLAEDFMLSLIEQVEEFRSSGRMTSRTYRVWIEEEVLQRNKKTNARIPSGKWSVKVLSDGDANSGDIDEEHKKQKKLLFGSLVLLSLDNMKTFVFGVVRNSPPTLQVEGVKGVQEDGWFNRCSLKALKGRDVLMMEAEAFYFPYFHVTEGLRRREDVPFMEEIVKAMSWKRTKPTYLEDPSVSDRIRMVRIEMSTQLNTSQLGAFDSVLQNRVALVQGPPGTGKTHLAVKIVQSLLAITSETREAAPILVVTTTNHAVEEFLKRCLKFTQNVLHARGVARDDVTRGEQPDYGELQRSYDACPNRLQQKGIMSRAEVIAMTTSRATFVRQDLDGLKIKIVLVEEAAEALEAYIITSIPSTAQHLIMLGDHKQLRPITSHISLSTKYRLDVSLLERLVSNGFECPMLLEQRRMRPEIARLVKHIYPKLINHPSTEGRPDIAGVENNLLFFTHNQPEDQDLPNPSYLNLFEARMSAMLVKFLESAGHEAEHITVLATYKKQVQQIRQMMRNIGCSSSVRVTCVDNFQGEENKIIVLSLTRSNYGGLIGFMKKENRACVALSRARDGLYILGSMRTLEASGAPVWQEVARALRAQGALDSCFPLRCPHGRKFACSNAQHIEDAIQGCVLCAVENLVTLAKGEWTRAKKKNEEALTWTANAANRNNIFKRAKSLRQAEQNLVEAMMKLKIYQALFKQRMININKDSVESVDLMIKMSKLSLNNNIIFN